MEKETEEGSLTQMGHPRSEIDWDRLDAMLEADCDGTEIAGFFGVCADTLYRHCKVDKGMTFAAYKQQKKSKGDSKLKITQYKMALNEDRGMLIWLGKNRLNQKDAPTNEKSPNDNALDKLADEIKAHGVKV